MKNTFFLIIGALIIIVSFYLFLTRPAPVRYQNNQEQVEEGEVLKINGNIIRVDVADTYDERAQGLSGRESLEANTGVLFVFDTPAKHGIWMKDMKFPIDVLWIDEGMKIIWIEHSRGPETFPTIFTPPTDAKYVLEIPSGTALSQGIELDAVVQFGNE